MTEYHYQTSTHPSPLPYPIITIALSDLTARTETNDELFNEVLGTLDPLIGEGYVLVVLAAGSSPGLGRRAIDAEGKGKEKMKDPGFGWWLSKWRSVPHGSVPSIASMNIADDMTGIERLSRGWYDYSAHNIDWANETVSSPSVSFHAKYALYDSRSRY
jgi:hypothetical protein